IDTLGGDIVRVALPDFPVSLEAQDGPFILMHNNGGVYVAQSGLIGSEGPDAAPGGRPRYTVAQNEYTLESGELNVDLVTTTTDGVTITKRFIVNADDYLIRLQYLIDNNSTS